MNGHRLLVGALSALSLSIAGLAIAAEQGAPAPGSTEHMEHGVEGGMSCHDMMGMMGGAMMGRGMMNHGQSQNQMMPALPPGNEKLNMQMQAEMMQAMGAIMQKYASKIAPPQGK